MTHCMIDLETLHTCPNAIILTLGGIKFNPYSDTEPYDQIYVKIDIDNQSELGRQSSDDTLSWWSKQPEKAKNEAFDVNNRLLLSDSLTKLTKWVWGADTIWGHGYGFDLTILEDAYRSCDMAIPWNFWQVKDSRTLFSLCKVDPRKSMQTDLHNALADAYYQAKGVQIAYKELNINNQ